MFKWDILGQFILYYGISLIVIYFISDYAIFPAPKSSYQDKEIQALKFKTTDDKKITAVYLKNPIARFTVLFSHGNAEDLGYLMPYLEIYREHGFSIFAYDYHGYGTSEGRPSETNTYRDIAAAYLYLTETLHVPPDQIILHGRSLGTGPTLELASLKPCKAVILESPMVTAFQIMTVVPIFPLDKYRNNQKIARVHVPLLIIHGVQDSVIPLWHGKRLYELANSPKTFAPINGANHNDILVIAPNDYWSAIQNFRNSLER